MIFLQPDEATSDEPYFPPWPHAMVMRSEVSVMTNVPMASRIEALAFSSSASLACAEKIACAVPCVAFASNTTSMPPAPRSGLTPSFSIAMVWPAQACSVVLAG